MKRLLLYEEVRVGVVFQGGSVCGYVDAGGISRVRGGDGLQ